MGDTGKWDVEKSKAKANQAATGAVAGGGVLAAALVFVRLAFPGTLPWPVEADPVLVTVAAGVTGWFRTFYRDKLKHGGASVPDNAGKALPVAVTALLAIMTVIILLFSYTGCMARLQQHPDGTVIREGGLNGDQITVALQLLLIHGPEAVERYTDAVERLRELDRRARSASTEEDRAAIRAEREEVAASIAAMISAVKPFFPSVYGAEE